MARQNLLPFQGPSTCRGGFTQRLLLLHSVHSLGPLGTLIIPTETKPATPSHLPGPSTRRGGFTHLPGPSECRGGSNSPTVRAPPWTNLKQFKQIKIISQISDYRLRAIPGEFRELSRDLSPRKVPGTFLRSGVAINHVHAL